MRKQVYKSHRMECIENENDFIIYIYIFIYIYIYTHYTSQKNSKNFNVFFKSPLLTKPAFI